MSPTVRQIPTPPEARALGSLSRIDYSDAFIAETDRAQDLTAEQWMRRILEASPNRFRLLAPAAWFSLGLKHGLPWSDETLLGWRIRRKEDDWILVGAESRVGSPAELLLRRETDSIHFSTLAQIGNPVMRGVWAAIERPHQRIVAQLLGRAVKGD